jgi:D-sedoheptulose 7-phosphate isomerase
MQDYCETYLAQTAEIARRIDCSAVAQAIRVIRETRDSGGRLFLVGVGGGAGNCAHAVNDFRKIAGIEAYAPTDNASELTARVNDEGWESVFVQWLRTSRLSSRDCVLVFSVGGGNVEKKISVNIVAAVAYAREQGAHVVGIVGRDGGYTRQHADACVVIPTVDPATVTPHTESFQAVIWHLIVSHPDMKRHEMKWESVQ